MMLDASRFNTTSGTAPATSGAASPLSVAARVIDANAQMQSSGPRAEGLREVVAAANRAVKSLQNAVELSLDAKSGQPIVRVVDTETGELIRQIPTEEVLELRRALDRIAGLLIQRTA